MFAIPIKKQHVERLQKGYPWVFAGALNTTQFPPSGELVYLVDHLKRPFAIAYFNDESKIKCRILSWNVKQTIDTAFFYQLFKAALDKRNQRFALPYYRLVHAEGDGLSGLIIDRFDDKLVCQTGTLGMEKLKSLWVPALQQLLAPNEMIYRNDASIRAHEGMASTSETLVTQAQDVKIIENDVIFFASPHEGQKTGWFYDHRANRRWVAMQAKGKSVLDLYTYSGGFGLTCAAKGAASVTLVDSSEKSLALAQKAAQENQLASQCHWVKAKVFDYLEALIEQNKQFQVVCVDPPAFIKTSKDKVQGLKGYEKLARLASQVVAPNGILFIASCSHHADVASFKTHALVGISKANRQATLLYKGGADKDHPIHPMLEENHYLKAFAFRLN